jgi:hypothetical protein
LGSSAAAAATRAAIPDASTIVTAATALAPVQIISLRMMPSHPERLSCATVPRHAE